MNATLRSDGLWRALASQMDSGTGEAVNGFWERVREFQRYIGLIYRSELAFEAKELGYEIIKKNNGTWEIFGVDQRDLQFFSKRRQNIEAFLKLHGLEGARAASYATLATRFSKKSVDRGELLETWKEFSKTDFEGLISSPREPQFIPEKSVTITENTRIVLNYAIDHLSEKKMIISELELANTALMARLNHTTTVDQVMEAINDAKSKGELIPISGASGQLEFTTPVLVRYEQDILNLLEEGKNKLKEITPSHKVDAYLLQQELLNHSTKLALKSLMTARDPIMGVEINSADDKMCLYRSIQDLAKIGKHKVIALGLNALQANDLKREYGFSRSESIAQFLQRINRQGERYARVDGQGVVVIVNDAGKLGLKDIHALAQITHQTGIRLLPVYDLKSTHSSRVGEPLPMMLKHGLVTVTIDTKAHFRDFKKPSKYELSSNIQDLIIKIEKNIIAVENDEERLKKITTQFVSLENSKRTHTQIIMPSGEQAEAVNQQIHNVLKSQNKFDKASLSVNILIPVYFTQAQYQLVKNYKVGQWLRFNETYRSLNLKRGDYVQIERIDSRNNTIFFKNSAGKEGISWRPDLVAGKKSGAVEVFRETDRDISLGEKIMLLRNQKSKNLANGEMFTVSGIKGDNLFLLNSQNKKIKMNMKLLENRHFDYGYSVSIHRSFDYKNRDIIAFQSSKARHTSQRSFYQLVNSTKGDITIYTDDKERYLNRVSIQNESKSALIDQIVKNAGLHYNSQRPTISKLNQELNQAIAVLIVQCMIPSASKDPKVIAEEAIRYAIANCSEREAAFAHKEIVAVALKHALGETKPSLIQEAVKTAEENGLLLRGKYVSDGTRWTTPKALKRERFILQWAESGKNQFKPIATMTVVEAYLEGKNYTSEQAEAVKMLATSTDRLVMIQGAPGTGKTTLLRATNEFLKSQGYSMQYLAPTLSAVGELNKEGLNAITAQKFLADYRKAEALNAVKSLNKTLFVLDESSFVSNRQQEAFSKAVEKMQGRAQLVGDRKQIASLEAGKPSTLLEWSGTSMAYLSDIRRQKNPELLSAVKAAHSGRFGDSFKLLESSLIDDTKLIKQAEIRTVNAGFEFDEEKIDRKQLRFEAVIEKFFEHFDQTKQLAMVITLTNENRKTLNEMLREGLKNRAQIEKTGVETTIFEPQHLTEVDKARVSSFIPQQWIRFSLSDEALDIKKGEYLQIDSINKEHNLVLLKRESGDIIVWRPKPYQEEKPIGIEVYAASVRELAVGDTIRWTRSDKANDRIGGELLTVHSITDNQALLVDKNHKILTLNLKEKSNQHWDHAYAVTTHFAQGKTDQKPIGLIESYHVNLTNQSTFIVIISRATDAVTIVTDDQDALLKQVMKNSGEKWSALEVMGEITKPDSDAQLIENSINNLGNNHETAKEKEKLSYWNYAVISEKLNDRIEGVLGQLLGEPKRKSGHQYRYGTHKGSLFITVDGDKKGWWKDFQTDEGGRSLVSLVQRETGFGFKETLEYSAGLLRLTDEEKTSFSMIVRKENTVSKSFNAELTDHQKQMIKIAQHIAAEAQSAKGTLVEKYLREHRGISGEIPNSIYYHPSVYIKKHRDTFPAMLVKMQDEKGQLQSIHLTLLDEKTGNKANIFDPHFDSKLKFGPQPKTVGIDITNQPEKRDITLISEGLETAMSLSSALPQLDVKAALDKQNFKRIDIEKTGSHVVFCLDNDLKNWREDKVIVAAADRLVQSGKTVWVALPESINDKKTDFNDLIKTSGTEAIRETLDRSIRYETGRENHPFDIDSGPSLRQLISNFPSLHEKQSFSSREQEYLKKNNISCIHEYDKFTSEIDFKRDVFIKNLAQLDVESVINKKDDPLTALMKDTDKNNPIKPEKSHDFEQEI